MTLFQEKAQEYFSFLIDEFGFHVHEANAYMIVWKKERFYINVRYDARRSYELDIGYGYDDSNDSDDSKIQDYSLYELYEILQYAEIKFDSCLYQASDAESLSTLLKTMADLLHVTCRKVDLFVPEVFDALQDIRDKNCLNYARQKLDEQGNNLWMSRDYSSLVQLYEYNADILTPLEKERLDYAKKHIQ